MNSTNNTNLTLDFDQSIVFLFEELNELGISPNNILNFSNIDENNMINNNLDDCGNNNDNNNINSKDNDRESREKERERNETSNNSIGATKLIQDNILMKCHKASINVDNSAYDSDCNSDDTNKDPDYNADSESSDKENNIVAQPIKPTEFNNTKSSLETSLNVSGQKICDDINLNVKCSKSGGIEKQNFCYYCKKMQSKISRHLERVHKNEEKVKKFTALPKGIENMLLKYN